MSNDRLERKNYMCSLHIPFVFVESFVDVDKDIHYRKGSWTFCLDISEGFDTDHFFILFFFHQFQCFCVCKQFCIPTQTSSIAVVTL